MGFLCHTHRKGPAVLWAVIVSLLAGHALTAQAQTYSQGYAFYVRGQFEQAEAAFARALAAARTASDKGRTFKMMGISQYMQGKRVKADESFRQALRFNPHTVISKSEVLDESVIGFFAAIKDSTQPQKAKPKPPPVTRSRRRASPAAQGVLAIRSKVPAEILIDGVKKGTTGRRIRVPAGLHELQIRADGYKTITQPVKIPAGKVTALRVRLKKLEPSGGEPGAAEPPAVANPSVTAAPPAEAEKRKRKRPRRSAEDEVSDPGETAKGTEGRDESRSPPATWLYFLPGGIGQWANGDYIKAGLFFAAQAGSFTFYALKIDESNTLTVALNEYGAARVAEENTIDDETKKRAHRDETDEEFARRASEIADLRSIADLALIGAGVAWAASVADAFLSAPVAVTTTKKGAYRLGLPLEEGERLSLGLQIPTRRAPAWALDLRWDL